MTADRDEAEGRRQPFFGRGGREHRLQGLDGRFHPQRRLVFASWKLVSQDSNRPAASFFSASASGLAAGSGSAARRSFGKPSRSNDRRSPGRKRHLEVSPGPHDLGGLLLLQHRKLSKRTEAAAVRTTLSRSSRPSRTSGSIAAEEAFPRHFTTAARTPR